MVNTPVEYTLTVLRGYRIKKQNDHDLVGSQTVLKQTTPTQAAGYQNPNLTIRKAVSRGVFTLKKNKL